ncbi:MAG: hypothetical protein LBR65_09525 [Culturomica sp.]|jgi:hypothetical protein|nr:hypothetical protein [Culturomica sp.]
MTTEEQIARIERFLQQVIVGELGKLVQAELAFMQFVAMGQAIEVLGGFLDNRPMKAKGQAALRFAAAIDHLFGGNYRALNDGNYLYRKFRNQMTHALLPSREIRLVNREEQAGTARHLERSGGQLLFIAEVFYRDICTAASRLITLLQEGKIKPKNIVFEDAN